jgi:small subunit ribosomal protein S6
MPEQARLYDLMLVLSTTAEDERRAKILADVESQITSGGGAVERNDDWHGRPLAYEINHQTEGEYHLFQFTGPTALLEGLSHTLRIDDAVLRFRIIRVVPGTPPAPDTPPPVVAGTPTAPPAPPAAQATPAAAAAVPAEA